MNYSRHASRPDNLCKTMCKLDLQNALTRERNYFSTMRKAKDWREVKVVRAYLAMSDLRHHTMAGVLLAQESMQEINGISK